MELDVVLLLLQNNVTEITKYHWLEIWEQNKYK